jgi:hypothetical protein
MKTVGRLVVLFAVLSLLAAACAGGSKAPSPEVSDGVAEVTPSLTPDLPAAVSTPPLSQPPPPPVNTRVIRPATTTPLPEGWWAGAAASSRTVSRGGTVQIGVTVRYSQEGKALVDVEVHGPTGMVLQRWYDDQEFAANARSFSLPWNVAANAQRGRYTVKVGVFSAGWGLLYYWDDEALTISVN